MSKQDTQSSKTTDLLRATAQNQSKDSQSTEEINKEVNNDTQQVTAKNDDAKVESFNLNSKEEPLKVDNKRIQLQIKINLLKMIKGLKMA